jgi:hypothetical protein
LLLTFATSPTFQTSVGICSNVAMRISCFTGFFDFAALFARAAKNHTNIPNICTREKYWRPPILAPIWRATGISKQ